MSARALAQAPSQARARAQTGAAQISTDAAPPPCQRWLDLERRRYVLRALQAANSALLGELWNQGLSRPSRLTRFHASPGMSQKTGVPNSSAGVTGSASASGKFTASSRAVEFSYTVPDVRAFAPAAYTTQLGRAKTQTWVVKASEVPGSWGSNITKLHGAGDHSTSLTGSTSTAGNTCTTGRWLLLGQVSAQAVLAGCFKDFSYGFSCDLPVQNLNLQSPIYQAPTTLKP